MSAHIVAAGCVFPSGPGIALAEVALRTGFSLLRRHPFYVDRCGGHVQVSCFDDDTLPFDAGRWAALAEAALADLLAQLGDRPPRWLDHRPWKAWLVLPEDARPASPQRLYGIVEPVLAEWPYRIAEVHVRAGGHAAGVAALADVARHCQADPETPALVLAIDSQVGFEALLALEARRLLHGARAPYEGRARANPYGRVPGEGAAALLLTAQPRKAAWCRLGAIALAEEGRSFDQPEPCVGLGLGRCARDALDAASLDRTPVSSLIHDVTGEPYRADEFGFAALRLAPRLGPNYRRFTPAVASGDLGAASAIAHTALAAWQCRDSHDGAAHLLLASSDDRLRGAIVLCAPAEEARWD